MSRQEGLQAERTVLAWDRTALAVLGNGALLLVRATEATGPFALVAGGLALVAALLVAVLGRRRARSLRNLGDTLPGATVPLAVTAVAVLAVGVAVTVLLVSAAS